jgi:predicted Zn-dependent protease
MKNFISIVFLSLLFLSLNSCAFLSKTGSALDKVNVFSPDDDMQLGLQVKQEIESSPDKFPILDQKTNREIYAYLNSLMDVVLNSGELKYKDKFNWEIKIINDDKTINAFAVPGGHMYYYTGLIKFLESEDELLAVIAHEMAHIDLRHSTRQLTKNFGIAMLLSAALGDKEAVQQISGALLAIQFTRANEVEADEYSVRYLCNTPYNAAASANFFRKMLGQPTPPEFLSTHPSPKNRVRDIEEIKNKLGCKGTLTNIQRYEKMKKLLR